MPFMQQQRPARPKPMGTLSLPGPERWFDLLICALIAPLMLPVLLLLSILAYLRNGRILDAEPRLGRQGSFLHYTFAGQQRGHKLALLLNIVRGDMSWIGPQALTVAEAAKVPANCIQRFKLRPGLVSPWTLQQRVGIAHQAEHLYNYAELADLSLRARIGLLGRALLSLLLNGNRQRPQPAQLKIFGIAIDNLKLQPALDWIMQQASGTRPSLLVFVNPHCLNIAYRQQAYRQVLQQADRVLPDGIGIKLGCRIQGVELAANLNGTDLFPLLCEQAARSGHSLYLLGGRPGIAQAVAENMQQRYPGLIIAGTQHGYFSAAEEPAIIDNINASGARFLFVAMGVPRQELWLAKQQQHLRVPLSLGVGGLFDFYSGRIPRAPLWLREIGLEWSWRLLQEPGRMWRRYLIGNPLFLYRVWREKRAGKSRS